jgi:hypothetical protein
MLTCKERMASYVERREIATRFLRKKKDPGEPGSDASSNYSAVGWRSAAMLPAASRRLRVAAGIAKPAAVVVVSTARFVAAALLVATTLLATRVLLTAATVAAVHAALLCCT